MNCLVLRLAGGVLTDGSVPLVVLDDNVELTVWPALFVHDAAAVRGLFISLLCSVPGVVHIDDCEIDCSVDLNIEELFEMFGSVFLLISGVASFKSGSP